MATRAIPGGDNRHCAHCMHMPHMMHTVLLLSRMPVVTFVTDGADKCHFRSSSNNIMIPAICAIFHKWCRVMAEMLTAKEMQTLLHVDRSTIYRMAEAGSLPAIKVGKQWRFPSEQVDNWMGKQMAPATLGNRPISPAGTVPGKSSGTSEFAAMLPIECVQLIQETYADLLGVMLVVTDMEGNPLTEVSNPCGLFGAISLIPDAVHKCIESWHDLATSINLEPQFNRSHLGLMCARGMVRVGTELKGMVVAGCVAPAVWPPTASELQEMADEFGVEPKLLSDHFEDVYQLSSEQQATVLSYVQRIANIVAHIVGERKVLMGKLEAIADLATN